MYFVKLFCIYKLITVKKEIVIIYISIYTVAQLTSFLYFHHSKVIFQISHSISHMSKSNYIQHTGAAINLHLQNSYQCTSYLSACPKMSNSVSPHYIWKVYLLYLRIPMSFVAFLVTAVMVLDCFIAGLAIEAFVSLRGCMAWVKAELFL